MARTFTKVAGIAMYLNALPPGGLTMPFSMSCWVRVTSLTGGGKIFVVGMDETYLGVTGSGDFFSLAYAGTGNIQAQAGSGGGGSTATSSTAISTNTWANIVATFTSATSRSVFLNGGGKVTNSSSRNPTIYNSIWLGGYDTITNGAIAHAAIWNNLTLSDDDALTLSKGISPKKVRPDKLVFHMRLEGSYYPEIDVRGGLVIPYQGGSPLGRLDSPRQFQMIGAHPVTKQIPAPSGGPFPNYVGRSMSGGMLTMGGGL